MVIWLALGLQAAITLGNQMGSRSCPQGLSGSYGGGCCTTADSCGQSLEVGGRSCPVL